MAWPWCTLAASQRRPYWHPRTVILPWGQTVGSETSLAEFVYGVTVTFKMTEPADQRICLNAPAHSKVLVQAFFGKTSLHPGLSAPLQPRFGSLRRMVFLKAKNRRWKWGDLWMQRSHNTQAQSQRHLTADWLAPRESDCSRMRSNVFSNWLPSYFKATRPVF